MARKRKPAQAEFYFPSWGGRRRGAGRPKSRDSGVAHTTRPRFSARHSVHVTIKLTAQLGSLRTKTKVKAIRVAITKSIAGGMRGTDWSVQHNHIHALVESSSSDELSRRMQGLCVRIARALNRAVGRRGTVFADRYHMEVLDNPRQVRNAKAYVLLNARRHAAQRGRSYPSDWMDPCSSWAWSEGWKDCPASWVREARAGPAALRCTAPPTTWMLKVGWRRHGLIRIDEVPGLCSK